MELVLGPGETVLYQMQCSVFSWVVRKGCPIEAREKVKYLLLCSPFLRDKWERVLFGLLTLNEIEVNMTPLLDI